MGKNKKSASTQLLDDKIASLTEDINPKEVNNTMIFNALNSLENSVEESIYKTSTIPIIKEEEITPKKEEVIESKKQVEYKPESIPTYEEKKEEKIDFTELMDKHKEENYVPLTKEVKESKPVQEVYNLDNRKEKDYHTRMLTFIVSTILLAVIAITTLTLCYQTIEFINVSVDEKGTNSYNVCLKENEYYKQECLGEDQAYLSLLTEKMNVEFTYQKLSSEPVEVNTTYKVIADLSIQKDDTSVLYSESYTLVPETAYTSTKNVAYIVQTVEVPYKDYNELVNSYLTKYGITSNAQVVVKMYVGNDVVSSVTIPLSSQTYRITKYEYQNSYTTTKMDTNFSTNTIIYGSVGIISLLGAITLLALTLSKLKHYTKPESKFDKEVNRLLKEYDRFIVESSMQDTTKNIGSKEIYKVKSFNELLDARDAVEKPIIFVKINSVKCGFYIIDQNVCYEYIMKEVDMK